jgi:hypothetical protein
MRASESFRAFFACVGFWFFMAMLIFGYLARPAETTSSGLPYWRKQIEGRRKYTPRREFIGLKSSLAPVFTDLHRLGQGRESKLLFHRRNKKVVAARTQDRGRTIILRSPSAARTDLEWRAATKTAR